MTQIKLSKCKIDQLVALCDEHGNQPGELINILHKAQELFGYLPREVQEVIARQLNIPVSKVYGVVTFYSFFSMTPKGEHPISVCMGTACYVRGAEKVLDEFKRLLNINVGETTPDGKFSLTSLRCVLRGCLRARARRPHRREGLRSGSPRRRGENPPGISIIP